VRVRNVLAGRQTSSLACLPIKPYAAAAARSGQAAVGNRSSAHLHRQVPQVFVVQLKRVCAHVHRLPGLELLLQRLYDGKDVARCTAGDACAVFGVRVY